MSKPRSFLNPLIEIYQENERKANKKNMVLNPLIKYNKLKRFSAYVHDTIRDGVEKEFPRIDCLFNGDIYTRRDMWEKMDAIADCASLVELRKYETGEIVIHNANYCHNPIVCPVCADRVSKRRRAIFDEPIKRAVRRFGVDPCSGDWKSHYPRGYTGVYLATATIENGPDLKSRIDLLHDSIRQMIRKGQKRGSGRGNGEWSKVRAAIGNTETKIGSGSNEWHVHCHFLIFTDEPIDIRINEGEYIVERFGEKQSVSKWNYEWFNSTGGTAINFDVRPIQHKKFIHGVECATFEESVSRQSQEVIKYSTCLSGKKGTGTLSPAQYVELIQRRGNRRLFNTYGVLRCDKRNPGSLITISERELRRLEYVEGIDKKCYEVLSSLWQHGGSYSEMSKQDGALFSSSDDMKTQWINIRRRAFLAQTAKYQGEYRRERNGLFKNRILFNDKSTFENLLDTCRDMFRRKVSTLWQKYGDSTFLPEFLTDFNSDGLAGFKAEYLKLSF